MCKFTHTAEDGNKRIAAAMAQKLLTLLQDAGLRRRMGEAGRKRVEEHFTARKMAADVERLYSDLLSRSSAPRPFDSGISVSAWAGIHACPRK